MAKRGRKPGAQTPISKMPEKVKVEVESKPEEKIEVNTEQKMEEKIEIEETTVKAPIEETPFAGDPDFVKAVKSRKVREEDYETKTDKFVLPNITVKVQPIFREGKFLPVNHVAHFLYGGAAKKFDLPKLASTNSYKNPFSSKEEQKTLEDLLGVELNPFLPKNQNFFTSYRVTLGKEPTTLTLSNPQEYLKYLVLKANEHRIASSWEQRNQSLQYEYAMTEEGFRQKEALSRETIKTEAYQLYENLKKSHTDMRAFLIASGESIAPHTKVDWLRSKIFEEHFEGKEAHFIKMASDMGTARYKALIYDALRVKAIIINNMGAYTIPEVPGTIANSEGELISWLKHPENSREVAKIKFRAGHTE